MFHQSQAVATYRELLYTGVTRAREELIVLCEANTFVKGITSQRLPGETIQEKLKAFDKWLAGQTKMGGGNQSEIPKGLGLLKMRNGQATDKIDGELYE